MEIINKQTILLAAMGVVAVFFWAFGINSLKDSTASLLVVANQNENNAANDKIPTINQVNTISISISSPKIVNEGVSMRLNIPEINVNAKIDSLGVTEDGAMESPSGSQDVGWFAFGPRPGENGSAVLAGHYGRWKNGDVSVFDDLHTLKPGDKLYVEDENGVTIIFVVRELLTYDKNDDASQVFTSDDGGSHLNIIACAGVYDEALKTYSNRLVVFSDKQ